MCLILQEQKIKKMTVRGGIKYKEIACIHIELRTTNDYLMAIKNLDASILQTKITKTLFSECEKLSCCNL